MVEDIRSRIKNLVKEHLEKTRDCKFKKAWIPEGWACVEIDTFASHISEEICRVIYEEKQ